MLDSAPIKHLRMLFIESGDKELQERIIKRIIKKVLVGPNFAKISFMVGEMNISLGTDGLEIIASKNGSEGVDSFGAIPISSIQLFSKNRCSNSLTSGAQRGT